MRLTINKSLAACLLAIPGCGIAPPDHADRLPRGMLYYLDGAGAAGITTWITGVRQGLVNGGYDGAAERFIWQTGLGLIADQTASNDYKRQRAADLARRILEYRDAYPDAPITIIAKSAGTAVAVFALEALPADAAIDNVGELGYDFSQGYTSLEREAARPRQPGYFERRRIRKEQARRQREAQRREELARRVDAILTKISTHGMQSLTSEERRILKQETERQRSSKT